MEYVSMDIDERNAFKAKCADDAQLKELGTTYRMYKYSDQFGNSNSGDNQYCCKQ